MATTTKQKNDVKKLKKEVELLRSFMIGFIGKDKEGDYNPEFVKNIFKAIEKKPDYKFNNSASFLAHLRQNK